MCYIKFPFVLALLMHSGNMCWCKNAAEETVLVEKPYLSEKMKVVLWICLNQLQVSFLVFHRVSELSC